MIKRLISKFKRTLANRNSQSIVNFYRSKGIKIGDDCFALHPPSLEIDYTRPSLVSIGNHVFLHKGLTILTHDYVSWLFTELYDDFIPSHGRVSIGDNVWFGYNCTVLKGVTIGNNCIIGIGSVVAKDIPANSVAAGIPAKVICSVDDYYRKRKVQYKDEVMDYAKSIYERFNRLPVIEDFYDDYPAFVGKDNVVKYPNMPYEKVLKGEHFLRWKENHVPYHEGFDGFLKEFNSLIKK